MFGGINDWRDGNNPDKMILEAAGAHTFYSDTLEKLEALLPWNAELLALKKVAQYD